MKKFTENLERKEKKIFFVLTMIQQLDNLVKEYEQILHPVFFHLETPLQ